MPRLKRLKLGWRIIEKRKQAPKLAQIVALRTLGLGWDDLAPVGVWHIAQGCARCWDVLLTFQFGPTANRGRVVGAQRLAPALAAHNPMIVVVSRDGTGAAHAQMRHGSGPRWLSTHHATLFGFQVCLSCAGRARPSNTHRRTTGQ